MTPGRKPMNVKIKLIQKCFVIPTSSAAAIGGRKIARIIFKIFIMVILNVKLIKNKYNEKELTF